MRWSAIPPFGVPSSSWGQGAWARQSCFTTPYKGSLMTVCHPNTSSTFPSKHPFIMAFRWNAWCTFRLRLRMNPCRHQGNISFSSTRCSTWKTGKSTLNHWPTLTWTSSLLHPEAQPLHWKKAATKAGRGVSPTSASLHWRFMNTSCCTSKSRCWKRM